MASSSVSNASMILDGIQAAGMNGLASGVKNAVKDNGFSQVMTRTLDHSILTDEVRNGQSALNAGTSRDSLLAAAQVPTQGNTTSDSGKTLQNAWEKSSTTDKTQETASEKKSRDQVENKSDDGKKAQTKGVDQTENKENTANAEEADRITDEVKDAVEKAVEDVKEKIVEDLGVTEDKLVEMMQALGLTAADLLIPANVQTIALALSGEDAMSLLTDADMYQMVTDLTGFVKETVEGLAETLNISTEEVPQLMQQIEEQTAALDQPMMDTFTFAKVDTSEAIEEMSLPEMTGEAQEGLAVYSETDASMGEVTETKMPAATIVADAQQMDTTQTEGETVVITAGASDAENTAKVSEAEAKVVTETDPPVSDVKPEKEAVTETTAALPMKEVMPKKESEPSVEENRVSEEPEAETETVIRQANGSQNAENASTNEFSQQTGTGADAGAWAQQLFGAQTGMVDQMIQAATESSTQTASGIDVQDIMNQITEYMKIQVKADTTELEMQLTPESLGTITVRLAAKENALTAQFIAQNEAVKTVLEAQAVQLKENLDQQGIKVEAVEVTVSSHEFEESMQQSSGGEAQQQQREQAKQRSTRRLQLYDDIPLEEMDLSQEERIAAEMMEQNGNTVDYTA